ncbi:hypothetical protein [Desertivirga xinjiangensis]|uniref:hypothetical protein n=1 Tax=Desertivirga xinjiangensis TaxID=539206 RepID=UPI00210E1107|nr:hypothetical protein [Pedobacter xinjiangensis]
MRFTFDIPDSVLNIIPQELHNTLIHCCKRENEKWECSIVKDELITLEEVSKESYYQLTDTDILPHFRRYADDRDKILRRLLKNHFKDERDRDNLRFVVYYLNAALIDAKSHDPVLVRYTQQIGELFEALRIITHYDYNKIKVTFSLTNMKAEEGSFSEFDLLPDLLIKLTSTIMLSLPLNAEELDFIKSIQNKSVDQDAIKAKVKLYKERYSDPQEYLLLKGALAILKLLNIMKFGFRKSMSFASKPQLQLILDIYEVMNWKVKNVVVTKDLRNKLDYLSSHCRLGS